ncbi:hypothetical protein [Nonomuraea dietziae]|uniref:hypothetical protein n=1 Tax=Nonomuraea dietziae TaxID=65515 RepID=UPI0034116990
MADTSAPVLTTYLARNRLWRELGLVTGIALSMATLEPVWGLAGWFAGVLAAEVRLARARPTGPATGLSLLSPAASSFWYGSLALIATLAGWCLVEPPSERGWVLAAVAVALAVQTLLRRLRECPLAEGPIDLVATEEAIRSRSAHTLATGGGLVTLALVSRTGVINGLPLLTLGVVAFVAAVAIGTRTWSWGAPPWSSRLPAAVTATVLAGAAVSLPMMSTAPAATVTRPDGPFHTPVQWAERRGKTWMLTSGPYLAALTRADTTPLVLSPEGGHVVYRDRESARLQLLDLAGGRISDLQGKDPTFSSDGRRVATVIGGGVAVRDLAEQTTRTLPGYARIVGLGPDTLALTVAPAEEAGVADTELVTLDYEGRERARVPFDPSLTVWLDPSGDRLIVLTDYEVVTMDSRTGLVLDRAPLNKSLSHPRIVGWLSADRALVKEWRRLVVVTVATGKTVESPLPRRAVFGRVEK